MSRDDDMKRWTEAGRKLRAIDPEAYSRITKLAQTFIAAHTSDEDDQVFFARLASLAQKGAPS